MNTPKTLQIKHDGATLSVRLDRVSARNGIDDAMCAELTQALLDADEDKAVRCIVITGNGSDFCTGADLAGTAGNAPDNALDYRRPMRPYQALFKTLWDVETPVISAVRGRVAGIGWMLALLADLVVAAEDSKWTHVFTRRGMAPHAGDPFFLPRILPLHVLTEIAFLGDTIGPDLLLRHGAINRVVADSNVEDTAAALAERIAAGPTLSLGQAKRLYRRSLSTDIETAFAEESAALGMLSQTSDLSLIHI